MLNVEPSCVFMTNLPGIRLSKQEQEQQQTVVRAEIVTYRESDLPRQVQTNANSMVCSLM